MNPFFDWLKDTGTQAVLVLLGTVAACIAAICTIYFGRKSLTKKDLARVEQNTAHLEEVRTSIANVDRRTKGQEEARDLGKKATFVSITVKGEADAGQPVSIYLTGTEPDIHFTRVEFRSELGNVFGASECIPTGNLFQYIARLPSDHLTNWRSAGTGVSSSGTRHILRVWMRFGDRIHQVHRDMAVSITSDTRAIDGNERNRMAIFKIDGRV